MKMKKYLLSILSIAALILELFPNGVVLRFANPDGEPWVRTYNYFSLTPFGYANFGPFITAILTCVLLILVMIGWFKYSKGLNVALMNVSGFATAASFLPLMFGVEYFTTIGFIIGLLLASIFGICFIRRNERQAV